MGCRDCSRCTERGATGLAMMIPRLFFNVFIGWWWYAFQKKCPQCNHPLSWHRQVDGKFAD